MIKSFIGVEFYQPKRNHKKIVSSTIQQLFELICR